MTFSWTFPHRQDYGIVPKGTEKAHQWESDLLLLSWEEKKQQSKNMTIDVSVLQQNVVLLQFQTINEIKRSVKPALNTILHWTI